MLLVDPIVLHVRWRIVENDCVLTRSMFIRALAGKIIVKYFVSTGPVIFPWQNSILRRIILLYPKAIARFSYKIRIKIFFTRGALLFSYRANPRRRTYNTYCILLFFIEGRFRLMHLLPFVVQFARRRSSIRRKFRFRDTRERETHEIRGFQREYAIKDVREKFRNIPLSRAVTSR